MDSLIVKFLDLVDKFILFPFRLAEMWLQLLDHMASLEWFVPRERARMFLVTEDVLAGSSG